MYVLYLNFGFICNDFVIIGFEVEWINLLHTFVFEASPNKSIELTLQNINECFSRRGSEVKTSRRGSLSWGRSKAPGNQVRDCQEEVQVESEFKHPRHLLVREESSRIKVLQWSARRCDYCQGEVFYSVVGGQLQSIVDGVTGYLAKSQATKRKFTRGLEESLRGTLIYPESKWTTSAR